MEDTAKAAAQKLLNNDIKPSQPRIKIMEYLIDKRNHPTVEQIHNNLVKEMPTLSKTTIYNNLNLFSEVGLVKIITIEENEARYDADTRDHGHFKCCQCGRIWDFECDLSMIEPKELSNCKITEKNVYFRGVCEKCL